MEVFVAERLIPRTADLEIWSSSLASRVVSQDKELHSTLPLFTQVCKRVLATYCWEVTLPWTSFNYLPAGAILLGMFHVKETGISFGRLDLWLYVRFNLYPYLYIV